MLIFFMGSVLMLSAQQTGRGNFITGSDFGGYNKISAYTKLGDSAWADSYRTSGIHINPRIGFFVADGFAMGLAANYSTNYSEYGNNIVARSQSYKAGPFLRFYVKAGGVAPFAEAEAGVWNRTDKISYSGTSATVKYPGWTAGAGVGLALFMGEKAAIEGKFGYYTEQYREEDSILLEKRKYNQFRFSIGASFFL
jgi:hypothetical protein